MADRAPTASTSGRVLRNTDAALAEIAALRAEQRLPSRSDASMVSNNLSFERHPSEVMSLGDRTASQVPFSGGQVPMPPPTSPQQHGANRSTNDMVPPLPPSPRRRVDPTVSTMTLGNGSTAGYRLREIYDRVDAKRQNEVTRGQLLKALRADPEVRAVLKLPKQINQTSDALADFERLFQLLDRDEDRTVTWEDFRDIYFSCTHEKFRPRQSPQFHWQDRSFLRRDDNSGAGEAPPSMVSTPTARDVASVMVPSRSASDERGTPALDDPSGLHDMTHNTMPAIDTTRLAVDDTAPETDGTLHSSARGAMTDQSAVALGVQNVVSVVYDESNPRVGADISSVSAFAAPAPSTAGGSQSQTSLVHEQPQIAAADDGCAPAGIVARRSEGAVARTASASTNVSRAGSTPGAAGRAGPTRAPSTSAASTGAGAIARAGSTPGTVARVGSTQGTVARAGSQAGGITREGSTHSRGGVLARVGSTAGTVARAGSTSASTPAGTVARVGSTKGVVARVGSHAREGSTAARGHGVVARVGSTTGIVRAGSTPAAGRGAVPRVESTASAAGGSQGTLSRAGSTPGHLGRAGSAAVVRVGSGAAPGPVVLHASPPREHAVPAAESFAARDPPCGGMLAVPDDAIGITVSSLSTATRQETIRSTSNANDTVRRPAVLPAPADARALIPMEPTATMSTFRTLSITNRDIPAAESPAPLAAPAIAPEADEPPSQAPPPPALQAHAQTQMPSAAPSAAGESQQVLPNLRSVSRIVKESDRVLDDTEQLLRVSQAGDGATLGAVQQEQGLESPRRVLYRTEQVLQVTRQLLGEDNVAQPPQVYSPQRRPVQVTYHGTSMSPSEFEHHLGTDFGINTFEKANAVLRETQRLLAGEPSTPPNVVAQRHVDPTLAQVPPPSTTLFEDSMPRGASPTPAYYTTPVAQPPLGGDVDGGVTSPSHAAAKRQARGLQPVGPRASQSVESRNRALAASSVHLAPQGHPAADTERQHSVSAAHHDGIAGVATPRVGPAGQSRSARRAAAAQADPSFAIEEARHVSPARRPAIRPSVGGPCGAPDELPHAAPAQARAPSEDTPVSVAVSASVALSETRSVPGPGGASSTVSALPPLSDFPKRKLDQSQATVALSSLDASFGVGERPPPEGPSSPVAGHRQPRRSRGQSLSRTLSPTSRARAVALRDKDALDVQRDDSQRRFISFALGTGAGDCSSATLMRTRMSVPGISPRKSANSSFVRSLSRSQSPSGRTFDCRSPVALPSPDTSMMVTKGRLAAAAPNDVQLADVSVGGTISVQQPPPSAFFHGSTAVSVADGLYKCMKGLGTDEDGIYDYLRNVGNSAAWNQVAQTFRNNHSDFHKGDVVAAMKDELTKKEREQCEDIMKPKGVDLFNTDVDPDVSIARALYECMKGMGTDEDGIYDLLKRVDDAGTWEGVVQSFAANHGDFHKGDVVAAMKNELSKEERERCEDIMKPKGVDLFGTDVDPNVSIARGLYKCMKGLGTDEDGIYDLLKRVDDAGAWDSVANAFAANHGNFHGGDVVAAMKDELNEKERKRCEEIMKPKGVDLFGWEEKSAEAVAEGLYKCMKGMGTDEDGIYDLLGCVHGASSWGNVVQAFRDNHSDFHKGDVAAALKDELSRKERKQCEEIMKPKGVDIFGTDLKPAAAVAQGLYLCMKGLGTDEDGIYKLLERVDGPIFWDEVMHAFKANHGDFHNGEVAAALKDELSRKERKRCEEIMEPKGVDIFNAGKGPAAAQAEGLYKCMKGMGTDEDGIYKTLEGVEDEAAWDALATAFKRHHSDFHKGDIAAALKDELNEKERERCESIMEPKGVDLFSRKRDRAALIADGLYKCMKGMGTDEDGIYSHLKRVEHAAEWATVAAAFKANHGDFHEGDVAAAMKDELTKKERGRCEEIMTPRGVDLFGTAGDESCSTQGLGSSVKPSSIADALHKAMKGFGTDEAAVYEQAELVRSPAVWRAVLDTFRLTYPAFHEGDLVAALRDELTKSEMARCAEILYRSAGVDIGVGFVASDDPALEPEAPSAERVAAIVPAMHRTLAEDPPNHHVVHQLLASVADAGEWGAVVDGYADTHSESLPGALQTHLDRPGLRRCDDILQQRGVQAALAADTRPAREGVQAADAMAKALHQAMKGFGTDEDAVYTELGKVTTPEQWLDVVDRFAVGYPKFCNGRLIHALKDELTETEFAKCRGILRERGVNIYGGPAEPLGAQDGANPTQAAEGAGARSPAADGGTPDADGQTPEDKAANEKLEGIAELIIDQHRQILQLEDAIVYAGIPLPEHLRAMRKGSVEHPMLRLVTQFWEDCKARELAGTAAPAPPTADHTPA